MDFATVLLVVVSAYAAVLTYLRATASKTKTKADDELLAVLEKAEPFVDAVKPKDAKK